MSDGKATPPTSPWQRPGDERPWVEETPLGQPERVEAPAPAPRRFPIRVSWLLLTLLLVAAALGGATEDLSELRRLGARPPLYGFHPRPEHLVLPLFLHGGLVHFAINFLSLFMVGTALEYVLGGAALLYVFMGAGVISLLGSMLHDPQATSVGCSGAVFGIWTARVLHAWIPPLDEDRYRFLGLYLLSLGLMVVPKAMGMPVDDLGHVAGMLGGVLSYLAWRSGKLGRICFLLALMGFCGWESRPPWSPF